MQIPNDVWVFQFDACLSQHCKTSSISAYPTEASNPLGQSLEIINEVILQ